ncbi:MAG: hypothetical protein ACKVPJ_07105 [Chitinophagales bacterium]
MPKVTKLSSIAFLLLLMQASAVSSQSMLGYTDFHGDFYVYDTDRSVQLEHQQIQNVQYASNSLAYISNTGDLKYYKNHKLLELSIANPKFYLNTDHYLYYGVGYSFSLFNGVKKEQLGFIQNHPFAFSDSIACMHDYAAYFYAYWKDAFVQLEAQPVKHCMAGDNVIAYADANNQLKVFLWGESQVLETLPPYSFACGANTVAYIDNYKYLKIFWQGDVFETGNYTELFCASGQNVFTIEDDFYCDAQLVVSETNLTPLFKTGDDLVAYIDSEDAFHIFYKGESREYHSSIPKMYEVTDNIVWWIDDNDFFHIFYDGIDVIVESYTPGKIKTDKNVVAYTDNYGKLKAFNKGESIEVSTSIVLDFQLNNELVMYNSVPNKYQFYKLK